MRRFALLFGLLAGCMLALASMPVAGQEKQKPGTGLKLDPKLTKVLRAADKVKHAGHVGNLPRVTAAKFDCRELGLVGIVQNQGTCGSCSNFQFAGLAEAALFKAGIVKNDGVFSLSRQQAMDCSDNGACGGGNGYVGLRWLKSGGKLTTTAVYGPYVGYQKACRTVSGGYGITDWGFCDSTNEIASVDSIKAAMVKYGPIASNLSADLLFNVGAGGIISGRGGNIDHAIKLIGWDDSKGKGGCWLMENSWGKGWADGGFAWIEYTSSSVGHDAEWCTAAGIVPPPTPEPPVEYAPPFFLTADAVPVGVAEGYGELALANVVGQQYATSNNVVVLVKDSKGTLANTLTPTVAPPPQPEPVPVPPGPAPSPSPSVRWHLLARPLFPLRGPQHWR